MVFIWLDLKYESQVTKITILIRLYKGCLIDTVTEFSFII